jgi:hypothetical protein
MFCTLCKHVFAHTHNAREMSYAISRTVFIQYLSRINSFAIDMWSPRINDGNIRKLSTKLATATRIHRIPVRTLPQSAREYIINQTSYYIGACIVSGNTPPFALHDIPIDRTFVRNSMTIMASKLSEFSDEFGRKNSDEKNIIETDTVDPVHIDILTIRFDNMIDTIIDQTDFGYIVSTCYDEYAMKSDTWRIRQPHDQAGVFV